MPTECISTVSNMWNAQGILTVQGPKFYFASISLKNYKRIKTLKYYEMVLSGNHLRTFKFFSRI